MKIVGLTGGVAAGKTTVSRFLGELGANVIDVDRLGHDLYEKDEVKSVIFETFPSVEDNGEVSRKKLGAIVFHNEEELEKLNNIMRPRLRKAIEENYSEDALNIVDMAILFESGFNEFCDKVVTVVTPYEVRVKRMEKRGYSEEKIIGILESQMTQKEKSSRSDYIINNYDEPKYLLKRRVTNLYNYLLEN